MPGFPTPGRKLKVICPKQTQNPVDAQDKIIAFFLYRSSRHHYGSFDSKEDVHSMTSINSPARVIIT
jgi:hypothetical protein